MLTRLRLALLAASVPSAAIVTSWAIGDLSEVGAAHSDRALDPVPMTPSTEAALGWSATLALVAGVATAVRALRSGGTPRRVTLAVPPLIGLAVFLGLGYRLHTASVVGANIGAGWWLLLSLVVAPWLVRRSARAYRDGCNAADPAFPSKERRRPSPAQLQNDGTPAEAGVPDGGRTQT